MNVLILTGNFGMGHVSAAGAVKEELEMEYNDATVCIVDLVEYLLPEGHRALYKSFNLVVGRCRRVYNILNRVDEKRLAMPLKKWFIGRFKTLLEQYSPDILISTWPVGSRYIGAYKERTGDRIPYITCITDISVHSEWISGETNAYIVGDADSKRELAEKGVSPSRVFVGGIPVGQRFKEEVKEKRVNNKEVLIMGGGLGLIPGINGIMGSLEKIPGVHCTVITGRNEKLKKALTGQYDNADIIGYTDRVDYYMKKADLIISKAGGITVFEAINTETPIFVPDPFLEQEKVNAEFIERKGIGKTFKYNEDTWEEVYENLAGERCDLTKMRRNMHCIKEQMNGSTLSSVIKFLGVA